MNDLEKTMNDLDKVIWSVIGTGYLLAVAGNIGNDNEAYQIGKYTAIVSMLSLAIKNGYQLIKEFKSNNKMN